MCQSTVRLFRASHRRTPKIFRLGFATWTVAACLVARAHAVTPESPEVIAVVEQGLAFLETAQDRRLGGKCLMALALLKGGRPQSHPQIQAAVAACESSRGEMQRQNYIYSKALAVIFLTELDAARYNSLIVDYAGMLDAHRKDHGGYGYTSDPSGDTSQTQYAALANWELLQTGVRPSGEYAAACTNWLLRTQSPAGAWGYKGNDPGSFDRTTQVRVTPCMLAAGLSSVLIFSDMLGVLEAGAQSPATVIADLPPELRPQQTGERRPTARLDGGGAVDRARILKAWEDGRRWLDENFTVDNGGRYSCYYLYALERYKSFEEHLQGNAAAEPDWYQKGFEYLNSQQQPDGSWTSSGDSQASCSTAFAVLFLLRSTKGSLHNLGAGTLVGGRGLPRDLSKASLKNGRLVVAATPTAVDDLLELIDNDDADTLSALMDNPAALQVDEVGPDEARRLEQVVRSGQPGARVLAVRALSRMRNLDYAPTLIYAMTDPDPRVVRAARDGLRFVSRRVDGFGLADNFADRDRYVAIDKWKQWYGLVRPDAPPLP